MMIDRPVAPSLLGPTATVTVRADVDADADFAVTVTDVAEAPSPTLDGLANSVTAGWMSSSASVIVAPVTLVRGLVPAMPIVSSPSFVASWVGVRVNVPVPVVAFAAIVIVKSATVA